MQNTLVTIVNLFKADVSELENIASHYTDLLSDMERLDNKSENNNEKTQEDKEVTMFTSRAKRSQL